MSGIGLLFIFKVSNWNNEWTEGIWVNQIITTCRATDVWDIGIIMIQLVLGINNVQNVYSIQQCLEIINNKFDKSVSDFISKIFCG